MISTTPAPLELAVASNTFSNDEGLRAALLAHFPRARFNRSGRILAGGELVEFLASTDAAIMGLEKIDAELIEACPRLVTISKFGVGLDNVDLDACGRRGVAVLSTPGVNAAAVAELTLGFMLALARRIAISTHYLKRGTWERNGGVSVLGKTVGLIGLGHVGKRTAAVMQAVGCQVLAHDLLDLRDYCATRSIRFASLDEVLGDSDFVSLHVPLTPRTRGMIGSAELAKMRSTAFLINTARGGVVDEEALCDALRDGAIAGAASDVFAEEPTGNTRLLSYPTFVGTPHIGGNSREAIHAVGMAAVTNLVAHLGRRADVAS